MLRTSLFLAPSRRPCLPSSTAESNILGFHNVLIFVAVPEQHYIEHQLSKEGVL